MSKKEELFCEECGADFAAGEECKCPIVAAELDPAREPDAIEVLISAAKKALQAIDAVNEEDEGPMAMPVPVAEDLREAIYNLEDIMALLPYELLVNLRMEMINADFNAKTMRNDGIEDLEAFQHKLAEEFGPMTPRQEDGIEIDPSVFDDDGMIGAANPAMLKKFEAKDGKDLAERNLSHLMKFGRAVSENEQIGMTIAEVIERYNPEVYAKCPHVEECISVDADHYQSCPHSDVHRVDTGCFMPCILHEGSTGCKPVEDSDEEPIA